MASDLPAPDSGELRELLPLAVHQAIYAVLYVRRDDPPTMQEIRDAVAEKLGDAAGSQVQLQRRVRDLRRHFVIPHPTAADGYRYRLTGRKEGTADEEQISARVRAEVLRHKRCEMCGRTPAEDGVRLHVDHKIPREWGGTNEPENLQALCSECNEGKKAYFATFAEHADKIQEAIGHEEPHRRIGELLKAFYPGEVRSDVIELVASAQQYQEDWQKRLRELRKLGWDYATRRERDDRGRVRVYYRLTNWEPWPEGKIRAEISRRERDKRRRRS